jgi:peptide/nickel transport system permease protein
VAGYLIRRSIAAIVTVWLILTAVFLIFFVFPGGSGDRIEGGFSPVAIAITGQHNTPEVLRRIESDLELDKPLIEQYASFMGRLASFDLGNSYASEGGQRIPVQPMIAASFRPTVELALGASVLALAVGLLGGFASAGGRNRWAASVFGGFSLIALSLPAFALGGLVVGVFAASGIYLADLYQPMSEGVAGWIQGMLAPWIVLAFPFMGIYHRIVRSSLSGVANEDFVRTAKAMGLHENTIIKQQMRASVVPLVTAFGIDLAHFLGGSIIVEEVFSIPGLGGLLLGATRGGDLPVVAGVTIVGSAAVVFLSLIVDLAYTYLDPRVVFTDKS